VLVDGLNLFHALRDQSDQDQNLNIRKLCEALGGANVTREIEMIYFTAVTKHLGSKFRESQTEYVKRIESTGAKVIYGEFRSNSKVCPICDQKYWTHSEKQTDVAIGAHMILQVMTNEFDEVLLFSADSDFLPALTLVREHKPHVSIIVLSTPKYLRPIYGLMHKAGVSTIRLSPELVTKFQF
jgi:uncharacterized LabA/DUF88 family protein